MLFYGITYSGKVYSKAHDGIESIRFSSSERTCDMNSDNLNIINCEPNNYQYICEDEENSQWKSYVTYLNGKTCPGTGEVGVAKDKACTCVQQKVYDIINGKKETSINNGDNNKAETWNKSLDTQTKSSDAKLSITDTDLKKVVSSTDLRNTDFKISNYNFKSSYVKNTYDKLNTNLDNKFPGSTAIEFIEQESKAQGINPILPFLVLTRESRGNPYAISPTGAAGLAQFTGGTAKSQEFSSIFTQITYCCTATEARAGTCNKNPKCTKENDDRFDSKKSLQAGILYLGNLAKKYNYNELLILTAYNTGSAVANQCNTEEYLQDSVKMKQCLLDKTETYYASSNPKKDEELAGYFNEIIGNMYS